jgi:uncharacterized protein YabN with tetrapyrrole methylase and pyrophosphatase domain
MREEIGELKKAEASSVHEEIEEEIGDLLFTVVNISRRHGIDPENALRLTIDKFLRRFGHIEKHLDATKGDLKTMDALWNEIKEQEKKGNESLFIRPSRRLMPADPSARSQFRTPPPLPSSEF